MDFNLRDRALDVEDAAGGLQVFLDHVPHSGAQISANMANMFFISSKLRSLNQDLSSPMFAPYAGRIMSDLSLALRSLSLTLDAIKDMFAQSRYATSSGMPAYGLAWEGFQTRLMNEGYTLTNRMGLYGRLFDALSNGIQGYARSFVRMFDIC
jgi:hypothetical protein